MMYKATKLIKEEMDRQELKYSVQESDTSSFIVAGFVRMVQMPEYSLFRRMMTMMLQFDCLVLLMTCPKTK